MCALYSFSHAKCMLKIKIPGTNRGVFNLDLGMMKAGIVANIHLILTTYKASAQSFQTVRGSFLHIFRKTLICIPWYFHFSHCIAIVCKQIEDGVCVLFILLLPELSMAFSLRHSNV